MSSTWTSIEGGYYGNPELSKKNRDIAAFQTKLLDAVDPSNDLYIGKNSGDKVAVRLNGRISGASTTPLSETDKIPIGALPQYTTSVQVYRYGKALAWTGTREDLDRISIKDATIRALREHSTRVHNSLINAALIAGRSFTYVAKTSSTYDWNTDGTVTDTAGANLTLFHLRKMRLLADRVNMPPADGTNFWFFGSPTIEENLLQDVGANGYVDVKKYAASGAEGVLNGEIGSAAGFRFVKDNASIADAIGTGSAYGSGFILGFEACKEALVYPMELRANMNLDSFGNQKAIAWQSLTGYKVLWNYTAHGQGSVIHYTSA